MTHEVNSRPLPPAGANAPGAAAHPSAMDRVDGGLEGLWHFLTSMRVAMVLMLAIAVLGIFGSLLSTPILNPPQSGILGMHTIQQRPVAVDGQVVIRPMMYLALSYDHRLVDGKEAVTFLIRIKDCINRIIANYFRTRLQPCLNSTIYSGT